MLINVWKLSITSSYVSFICRYSARMKENKSQRSKPIPNQQIKGRKHMKKCEQSYAFYLQPDNLQAFAHPFAAMVWKRLENKKTLKAEWEKEQSPYLWSPIRCARPWRETRAQSAINKGAWEGRVVTVTKMFSDRHLVSYEMCLGITEANQKHSFNSWLECLGAKIYRTAI